MDAAEFKCGLAALDILVGSGRLSLEQGQSQARDLVQRAIREADDFETRDLAACVGIQLLVEEFRA